MATKLTEGAISMLCNGKAQTGDVKPMLQVWDLRLVNSQQQQQNATERYRLMLSDGVHLQQGMLATQKNDLVKSGRLQKGSVVQLTQFVCNVIQQRMIIIIIDLEVILEICDPIGEPRQYGAATSGPAPVASSFTPAQSSLDRPNIAVGSVQPPKTEPSHGAHGGSYYTNSDSGRYPVTNPPPVYPRAESGAGLSGSVPFAGIHGDTNTGVRNPRTEPARSPSNIYARPPQVAYQQPPPMYANRGPIAKNEAPPRIIPIAALNPYQGRWTIKARVTAKGELRHYNNPRGDGKVFSFDLLDSEGGEIRVTCFNAVADQFYNQIEAGKVYMISKGSLKPAQKTFNHLRNDHEIFLESTSTVQPCFEDDSAIPKQQFHFRPISDVESMENNSVIDIIGVVSSITPASSILRKNGIETQKRSLQLKDMSARSVELTLWGNHCNADGQTLQNMCDSGNFPVLAVKSARVGDFNGKTVGTISTSQLFIEPDFPEARRLKEWFDKEGRNTPSVPISRESSIMGRSEIRKTVSQIKDEGLGTSEKPDWITVSATISFVKVDNFCYTACPIMIGDRQCNKKVTNNGDGKWRCDRCDQSVDDCDYRYILQLQIQDHTGLTWVTAFQESGEEIIGIAANDLYRLKYEEQDDDRFAEIIRKVLFTKFMFKLKVKEETFSDERRVKSTVVKAEKVNFSSESRYLLDLMDKLKGEDSSSFVPKAENMFPNFGSNNAGYGNVGSRQSPFPAMNNIGNSSILGREIGMQANQVGQYGNQYTSSRPTSGGTTATYLSCNSCGGSGHSSTNCPSIMNGPGHSVGGGYANRSSPGAGAGSASSECYKCHQSGHWARDCPGLSSLPPSYGSSGAAPSRNGGYSNQRVGGF